MKQILALAACAALLAGCDFIGGSDADPVAFSSLTITASPLPADNDGSAPDLYVEIQDAGGRAVYMAPSILEEADAGAFPYTIGAPGELNGSTRSYFVVVMDRDADGNDLIAASDGFSADDLRASASSTFAVSNAAGTLHAEIAISH
jgi:hypothetical protein